MAVLTGFQERLYTYMHQFLVATEEHGWPSRVRSDKGGENVDVAREVPEDRVTLQVLVFITSASSAFGETHSVVRVTVFMLVLRYGGQWHFVSY